MKKILFICFTILLFTSCRSISDSPYSVVGSWKFIDADIDVKTDSPTTDRLIKTAFVAYTSLGGGMDQLHGTIKFDREGRFTARNISTDYTNYGNTLVIKQKLLNTAGVNTKFEVDRKYDELYLTYDAKDAIASFSEGLINVNLNSISKANITLVFRKK